LVEALLRLRAIPAPRGHFGQQAHRCNVLGCLPQPLQRHGLGGIQPVRGKSNLRIHEFGRVLCEAAVL